MPEQDRYFRTKQDIARDLAIREQNAIANQQRVAMEQEAAAQQQGFISPGQNMRMAQITPGFDASMGTNAGGLAYQQGIDFGVNVGVPGVSPQPQRPQTESYANIAPPEELEQYNLEEFYDGYSKLNDIGRIAARANVDVNNPDPLDPDAMEIARQYHGLYNKLLQQGEALQQGYLATQEAQKRGQIVEAHQGPTQFGDAFEADKYDMDVKELGAFAKEMYTRGAVGDANTQLFGAPNASIEDAASSYGGRVGAYFYMADQLDAQGKPREANLIRQKMFDVLGPVYDSTKQQKLALDREDLDRKKAWDNYRKKKDFKKGYKKYNQVANLMEKIYRLQNHGEIGFIKQNHPDASYVSDSGTTYVTWEDPKTFEEVKIAIDDDEALAAQFMKDNPKFINVDMADYQEVKNKYGGYMPTADENWQVKINTAGLWNIVDGTVKAGSSTKSDVSRLKKYFEENVPTDLITVGGKKIKDVQTEEEADSLTGGSNELIFIMDDGEEMRWDLTDGEDMNALDELLKTVDATSAAKLMSNNPKKYEILNPKRFSSKGGIDWKNQGLINRVQRPDNASGLNREQEVLKRLESEYDIESNSSSVPTNSGGNNSGGNNSGIDITKIGY